MLLFCVLWAASFSRAYGQDPYEILEISRSATPEETQKAYRRMAQKWHPDRHPGDPEALERMKEINGAWQILKDSEKRRAYDRSPGDRSTPKQKPSYSNARQYSSPGLEEAIEIVKPYRTHLYDSELSTLAKFTDRSQLDALRAAVNVRGSSVAYDYEKLLMFKDSVSVEALRFAANARGSSVVHDYEMLLKFNDPASVDALRFAADARGSSVAYDYEKLLMFKDPIAVKALKIAADALGSSLHYSYEKLLKFNDPETVKALRFAANARGSSVAYDYEKLLMFKDPVSVKALGIAADVRGSSVSYDYEKLLRFKNPIAVEALRIAADARGSNLAYDYETLLTFDDPRMIQSLKEAIRKDGNYFSYNTVKSNALDASMRDLAPKFRFHDLSELLTDLTKWKPQTSLEGQALSGLLEIHLPQLYKLSPNDAQLKALATAMGKSDLGASYRKFLDQERYNAEFKETLARLKAQESVSSPATLTAALSEAKSAAERDAIQEFLKRRTIWLAGMHESATQLLETLSKMKFSGDFRQEVAIQFVRRSRSLNDYLLLAGLDGAGGNKPWIGFIDGTADEFLKLRPSFAEINRALKAGGLDKSRLKLVLAAVINASSIEELNSLYVPPRYLEEPAIKTLYRAKHRELSPSGAQKCVDFFRTLLK